MNAQARAHDARSGRAILALLATVLAAGLLRWHDDVREPRIKPDETVYVRAAELWSEGRSPYEESVFFYPPAFAWAASALTSRFGTLGYLEVQRAANLLAICLATWLSVSVARWRVAPALLISVVWIWFSPAVALSIELGNVAGIPTALTLASLWVWVRSPSLGGVGLGLAQAIKPIAPLAPLCLLVRRGESRRSSRLAGALAIAVFGSMMLIGWRHLPGLLGNVVGSEHPYNFSLQRILTGFGVDVGAIWLTALVGGGGLWWLVRNRCTRSEFLVVVVTLSLLAAPILWAHSLLLFLPVQLLAAARLLRSTRSMLSTRSTRELRAEGSETRALLAHVLAGLALASSVFSASVGGSSAAPGWLQSLVLSVPYLSLLYLCSYALGELKRAERGDAPQPRASQPA